MVSLHTGDASPAKAIATWRFIVLITYLVIVVIAQIYVQELQLS